MVSAATDHPKKFMSLNETLCLRLLKFLYNHSLTTDPTSSPAHAILLNKLKIVSRNILQ